MVTVTRKKTVNIGAEPAMLACERLLWCWTGGVSPDQGSASGQPGGPEDPSPAASLWSDPRLSTHSPGPVQPCRVPQGRSRLLSVARCSLCLELLSAVS